jgi:hypothetical protein
MESASEGTVARTHSPNAGQAAAIWSCTGQLASALLAGAQWAGRATVDRLRENSFLFLRHRSKRCCFPNARRRVQASAQAQSCVAAGQNTKARAAFLEELADLYGKRSRIVHAGSYDVTDADLARLRSITNCYCVSLRFGASAECPGRRLRRSLRPDRSIEVVRVSGNVQRDGVDSHAAGPVPAERALAIDHGAAETVAAIRAS